MKTPANRSTDVARRMALLGLATLAPLALSACSDESDPKPSAADTLLNFGRVKEAVEALSGTVDDLQSAISRFDSEDWKDVVPDVKTSAVNVTDSLDTLKQLMAGEPAN